MTTDTELLAEYARSRSDEAFRQLVVRHVNLVYSAALRQLRDRHMADDVTQAVFVVLTNNIDRVRDGSGLRAWLLLTTRNVAWNARRQEWRLKRREKRAAEMTPEETHCPGGS